MHFRYTAYRFSAALGAYRIAIGSSTVVGRRRQLLPGGDENLEHGHAAGTSHYLESTAVGAFGGQDCFQCGRPVRLYADGGTTVMLRADRDAPSGTGISRTTLSGHLIDTP